MFYLGRADLRWDFSSIPKYGYPQIFQRKWVLTMCTVGKSLMFLSGDLSRKLFQSVN